MDAKDWLIFDLVVQNCTIRDPKEYSLDSGFIRAHANAMDHLADIGLIELIGNPDREYRGRLGKIK